MKGRIVNANGEILIDENVISKYAGSKAVECFGIVGMAGISVKDGLVKLLKRENLSRGITVHFGDEGISLDFHVIVAYGISITAVADNLAQTVRYHVESFTGMKVNQINVLVDGVRVTEEP